jgi:restriction system protein
MPTKRPKGPVFLRFVAPVVATLRELGSSGTASEVTDRVIERCRISESDQVETTSNGQSRVRNQIGWARFYLTKAGLLDDSRRGIWALTDAGRSAKLDDDAVYSLFRQVQKSFPRKETSSEPAVEVAGLAVAADDDTEPDAPDGEPGDYRTELLSILRALPPAGFERVCQRLLRESGFQQVVVTGRANDGGIDGHGILEINPLVTFRILFQCKRYTDRPVTPSQVRDFRGAMQGRADKGLILTTGSFTIEARREATRDGAPPIELVDGDKLVTMFERVALGLRPVQTFVVDPSFFEEFRN